MQLRLLIYHIGSLGDTLAVVPALWAVRENFPGAHLTMLTNAPQDQVRVRAGDILEGSGLIDDYIYYSTTGPMQIARLFYQLRSSKHDALVYLINPYAATRREWRDRLFFRLAGIKRYFGISDLKKERVPSSTASTSGVPRVADALLARLSADGLRTPGPGHGRADVNLGECESENIRRWSAELPMDGGRKWLAIGLGSKMPCKIWPFERYLAVTKQLVDEYDIWPVVFGGAPDHEEGVRLVRELRRGYTAAGVLGIRDSMAAMRRCVLFLGNDTGTMHMAAASEVRCVVPFSSRDVNGKWYPYGEGHVLLRANVPCEGCMLEECVEKRMQCLLSISVAEVTEACRNVLKNRHLPGVVTVESTRGTDVPRDK